MRRTARPYHWGPAAVGNHLKSVRQLGSGTHIAQERRMRAPKPGWLVCDPGDRKLHGLGDDRPEVPEETQM